MEAFVYHSSTNFVSYESIIAQFVDSSGSDRAFVLETVGAGATSDLEFYYYDTSNNFVGPVQGTALQKNKWHHVAVCRSGSSIRIFIDGVGGTASSISVNIKNSTNAFTIGGNASGAGYWNGFISNARVINGTALYTSNFTPPTRELTNVTNTKLLCCQSPTLAGAAAVAPYTGGINDGTPWSEYITIPEGNTGTNYNDDASLMFDGDTSTAASLYSGNMVSPYSSTTVVFTPPSPITVSSGLRVYMAVNRGQKIIVKGVQTNASVSAGWNDTSFTGTLTSLVIGPSNLGS